jgi:hypothetical protein
MNILTFALVLRRMAALPRVLLLVARLGGNVTYVSAADGRANLVVLAPANAAHRFVPQLRRLIDVVELTELRMVARAGRGAPTAGHGRRAAAGR